MKNSFLRPCVALAMAALAMAVAPAPASAGRAPTRLIIDTDFGQWWDDVATLAAVHTAADRGEVRILGIVSDVRNEWNAPALDALDTWYGRPDIPIGVTAGATAVDQNYSEMLAENYPHSGRAEDSVALYRRLLRAQPDHSVTILSIGALTGLSRLLKTDRALVERKVARTVVMGGEYPRATAPEWNFGLDLGATRHVVADWPAPVVYDGFETGLPVLAGNNVCATHPAGSPVRAAFDVLYGCGNDQHDGTWDPTALYYAIYGTDGVFRLAGAGGHNVVTPDGLNAWTVGGHRQQYLVLTDAESLTTRLDALIDAV
ncbi:nucleoside hydrolase [Actinoplanes ianthinogenes]|uniref:Nucleoside hydrolase n=1 Tax=Actinoplanes ianthinogenes TaxID=122358 RepID=A0ABM7M6X3_9ACTN|nr:nucleoside hydrolase [Actinoplanes ianthinogenes]BCJ47329.1 nucleoside hydrolase [Actinoplanes ianthinogenes]GGR41985.1 nucleoside hydrolase [Actinoplanes ianthinogenes]